ncbi:MAG: hypothetical protein K2P99_02840 [Burkholderiales bacterium]|nr:hypothetical protein [Burkholderiales bacterium]
MSAGRSKTKHTKKKQLTSRERQREKRKKTKQIKGKQHEREEKKQRKQRKGIILSFPRFLSSFFFASCSFTFIV